MLRAFGSIVVNQWGMSRTVQLSVVMMMVMLRHSRRWCRRSESRVRTAVTKLACRAVTDAVIRSSRLVVVCCYAVVDKCGIVCVCCVLCWLGC